MKWALSGVYSIFQHTNTTHTQRTQLTPTTQTPMGFVHKVNSYTSAHAKNCISAPKRELGLERARRNGYYYCVVMLWVVVYQYNYRNGANTHCNTLFTQHHHTTHATLYTHTHTWGKRDDGVQCGRQFRSDSGYEGNAQLYRPRGLATAGDLQEFVRNWRRVLSFRRTDVRNEVWQLDVRWFSGM